MTAPDVRQSDELREVLAYTISDVGAPSTNHAWRYADALLPVVTAWAEKQSRARAAEELEAAARAVQRWGTQTDIANAKQLRDRAAALAADDWTDARVIRRWWPVLRDALTNMAGLVRDWRQR